MADDETPSPQAEYTWDTGDGTAHLAGRKDLVDLFMLRMIEQDQRDWPEGHPCRDCGRLHREHPHAECEAWR